ncbi:hypothetical protein LXL04_017699 [Taraxacum kok-saghyz]
MVTLQLFVNELFVNEENGKSEPNSLFDEYRNPYHLGSGLIDLDYQGQDRTDGFDQKEINLATMNRWMGKPDPLSNAEDMGNFYSAGYDPLFYVHHANVDRMWTLWKEMGGKEPDDKDWGDASYVFYDEKQESNHRPRGLKRPPRSRCFDPRLEIRTTTKSYTDIKDVKFPLSLTETKRLRVPRPAACINRDAEQKKKEKEILCINGIMFDGTKPIKFDVLVNECDAEYFTPCDSENVGSFAAIPHAKGGAMGCSSGMRFSFSELLEETGAEGKDSITVTIVPKATDNNIATIKNIEIRLIPVLEKLSK